MEDYEITFNVLKKYSEYLESQAEIIRTIRNNQSALENVLSKNALNIQACANELEAELDFRKCYFVQYVRALLKIEGLKELQIDELNKFEQQVLNYMQEFENPLVSVNYSEK